MVGLDLTQVLHAEVGGSRALRRLLQHQRLCEGRRVLGELTAPSPRDPSPGAPVPGTPSSGSHSSSSPQILRAPALGMPNLRESEPWGAQAPNPGPQRLGSPSGAGLSHHGATEMPPTAPQAPFQGVWGHSGSPLPPGVYLYAPDDGVVCPAHVGQGRALHQDLHSLDGTCRAQVVHGHLDSESSVTATLAGQWGARTLPMGTGFPRRLQTPPNPPRSIFPQSGATR